MEREREIYRELLREIESEGVIESDREWGSYREIESERVIERDKEREKGGMTQCMATIITT